MSAGGGTILDSLWIALGIKAEGDGLKDIKHQANEAKESLLSAGTAVKAFFAGFAVHEVAKIGASFENSQIQIAGFFTALGESSDFNKGLEDASQVMQQITKDAAALPGEADDYIETFKRGFSFIKAAMPGANRAQMAEFSDKLTAIGIGWRMDAGMIAREFDHMLTPGKGMASLRLPFFAQLLPYMQKVRNDMTFTAEKFNQMSAPDRIKLLQQVIGSMDPMIKAMEGSFDAMWGAAVSAIKQMTRVATVPLFKGMKQALDAINNALYDSNGKLTEFGQSIVDAVGTGVKYLTQFLAMGGHILLWFAKTQAGATAFKVAIGLLGLALTGLALEKTVSSFNKLFQVMGNIKSLLTGGLVAVLALIAEDLYQFYTGGNSVTGLLLKRFPQITAAFYQIKEVALDVFGFIKTSVSVLTAVFGVLGDAIADAIDADGIDAFKEEFTLAKPLIIAGAAAIAIALAGAFAPVYAAVVAFAAIIVAIDQIAKKKGFFYNRVQSMGKALAGAVAKPFGGLAGSPDLNGAGVLAADPTADLASRYSWNPAASSAPYAPGGGSAAAPVTNHTVIHNTIHIKSTHPSGAAKEVVRELARDGQSKVKG